MRGLIFWIVTAILVVGALSATVSMATVRWLYPDLSARAEQPASGPAAAAPAPATKAAGSASRSQPSTLPPLRSDASPPLSPDENLAMDVIRKAGGGDLSGARVLCAQLPDSLFQEISDLRPSPYRATLLPAPADAPEAQVLVWTRYRRAGLSARGYYVVKSLAGKVTGITGPYAPENGYRPLPWAPLDEVARRVDMTPYRGRGLVLIAPRLSDVTLLEEMARLQAEYSPLGVEFILVLDLGAPDWVGAARKAGFNGAIWRVKGQLEEVPVVIQGRHLGAVGLLVDRQGSTVASLAALDPSRYGLMERSMESIAGQVLRAFALLP